MKSMNRTILIILAGLVTALVVSGCGDPNNPPTVQISSPQEGIPHGGSVSFSSEADDSDGSISSYQWDFGDGNSSSEAQPSHTYEQSGTLRVELVVTDDKGDTATDGITIEIQLGPEAIAEIGRADSEENLRMQFIGDEAPLMIQFSGSRSNAEPGTQLVSYHWDFGNGDALDEADPTYTYLDAGDYTATLTVTDSRGNTSASEVRINVISYEAVLESIELADGELEYELHQKDSSQKSNTTSIFLKYVAYAERILTEEEISQVFDKIIEQASSRPRVTRITVQLFTEEKSQFMDPREYSHYAGLAVWDTRAEDPAPVINYNLSYLDGTAPRVLGYKITEELKLPGDPICGPICHEHRIGWFDIYLQEDGACLEDLDRTLREVVKWRLTATFEGFIGTIWTKDMVEIASMAGMRPEGPDMSELPFQIYKQPPSDWDILEDALWISHSDEIPDCESNP
jgi:PKD repeat protein